MIGFTEMSQAERVRRTISAVPDCLKGDTVAVILENEEHVHAVMWEAPGGSLSSADRGLRDVLLVFVVDHVAESPGDDLLGFGHDP